MWRRNSTIYLPFPFFQWKQKKMSVAWNCCWFFYDWRGNADSNIVPCCSVSVFDGLKCSRNANSVGKCMACTIFLWMICLLLRRGGWAQHNKTEEKAKETYCAKTRFASETIVMLCKETAVESNDSYVYMYVICLAWSLFTDLSCKFISETIDQNSKWKKLHLRPLNRVVACWDLDEGSNWEITDSKCCLCSLKTWWGLQ